MCGKRKTYKDKYEEWWTFISYLEDINNQEALRLAVYPVESINTIKYRIVCLARTLNLAFDLIEVVEINLLYKELK